MKRKIHRCFLTIACCFGLLLVHLGTVISNGTFLAVGINQSTRTVQIASGRGTIYDRNLTPLVNNTVQYRGALMPEYDQLYRLRGDMSQQEYQRLTEALNQQTLLVADLSRASLSGQKIRTFSIPKRYNSTVPCAHLLGHLDQSGQVGQTGIEKAYDALLAQYSGTITVTYSVDGIGRYQTDTSLKVTNTLQQCRGGVQLTIDGAIQSLLDTLAPQYISKGAALILDANSGEVLASASLPTYHPEQLSDSLSDENGALLNRVLSKYDCGSVFKIVTAAAALEQGVSPEQTYTCQGEITVENTTFHCHQRLGHQQLDMNHAFAQSCNLYFIQLAQQIGKQAILETAKAMGLYDCIDLAEGIRAPAATIPDATELFPAALANLSFGQGKLLLSPLHVAQLTSIVANNGIRTIPSIVLGTIDKEGTRTPIQKGREARALSETTCAQLRFMMELVVEEGTGTRAQPEKAAASGKTGTAQTGQYNGDKPVIQSWFTGYFPAESPQYTITILAEDAESNGGDPQSLFRELCNNLK